MIPSPPASRLCLCGHDLPAALRPYVAEIYEEAPAPCRGAVTLSATTASTMLVLVGAVDGSPSPGAPSVVLAGPRPEAATVVPGNGGRGLYVRFAPVGPYALFGLRHAPLDRPRLERPLDAHVRPDLAEAVRRFGAAVPVVADRGWSPAEAFAARAALTVTFLAHRADDLAPGTAFLQSAVDEIERRQGHLTVHTLARTLGVSESTLRRRFGVLGVPVKRFAKIVQFQHTHAYYHGVPGATWAETALRFGYADQSHLVHDYRRFAGTTPNRWRAEALPSGRGESGRSDRFLQDRGRRRPDVPSPSGGSGCA